MAVLTLNKKILKIFGMCLNDESASSKDRIVSKCVNWTILWISLCTVGVSFEYVISHFADTESILFAVMQIAANTASGGGYWTFYNKKYQVSKFLNRIENLVKLRMWFTSAFLFAISFISFTRLWDIDTIDKLKVSDNIAVPKISTKMLKRIQRLLQSGRSSFS